MKHPRLNEVLKQKRRAAGLTQKEVADLLGYSTPQFISNWERGLSYPPIKMLQKVAEIYRISTQDLFELFLEVEIEETKISLQRKFGRL